MSEEHDNTFRQIKDNRAKIESERNQLSQRYSDFQRDSKKHSKNFSTSLIQTKKNVISTLNSVMESIDSIINDISDYKNKTLTSEKESMNTLLTTLLSKVSQSLERINGEMIDLSTSQEEEISAIYLKMAQKVNTGISDIYQGHRSQISEFEQDISPRLETIQRDIISTVESESANLREMAENIAASFLEALDKFKQNIRSFGESKEVELDNIFAGTIRNSIGRMEMAKEDLLAGIDGLKDKLQENLDTQKANNQEMLKKVQEIVSSAKSDVKSRITTHKLDYMEDLEKLKEEQVSTLNEINERTSLKYQNALKVNENLQSTSLTDLGHQLRTTFKQLEEQILAKISKVSNEYDKSREETYSNLISTMDKRNSAISSSLDNFGKEFNSRYEDAVSGLNASLAEFFESTSNNIRENMTKRETTLDELQNSIYESFRVIQSGQEKNIETTSIDVQKALRSKQSEIITAIASVGPAAENYIESSLDLIGEKKSEISHSSTVAFDDLRKQMTAIARDNLSTILDIIQTTHHKLEETVQSSEKNTQDLMEGLKDQHKNALVKYRDNSGQEFNKHKLELDNYRNNLNKRLNDFFEEKQRSVELLIDENRSQREEMDEKRRNLDIKYEELQEGIESSIEILSRNLTTISENVTLSVKQVLRNVDAVIKSME